MIQVLYTAAIQNSQIYFPRKKKKIPRNKWLKIEYLVKNSGKRAPYNENFNWYLLEYIFRFIIEILFLPSIFI